MLTSDSCAGRGKRQREVHCNLTVAEILQSRFRTDHIGRDRHKETAAEVAETADGPGEPGACAVQRHDPSKHCLWKTRKRD